ncbi:hypothetical protein KAR91_19510 [Candidatus Pacearchaeota archaeon]|nr:hypothetical protein [Candidatus Pacearchaeota archaeon]
MSKLKVSDEMFITWVTSILRVHCDKPFDSIEKTIPNGYEFDLILNDPHPHTTEVITLNSKFLRTFNKEQLTEEERELYINILMYAISLETGGEGSAQKLDAVNLLAIHDASPTARIYSLYTVLYKRDKENGIPK